MILNCCLAVFLVASAVMWAVLTYDFCLFLNRKYRLFSRRRGFDRYDEWKTALVACATKMQRRRAHIPSLDNTRLILLDRVHEKVRGSRAIQGWQYAPLAAALKVGWRYRAEVDDGFASYLCEETEIAEFCSWIMQKRISPEGLVVYRAGCRQVYVDTLAFVCPLLMRYARKCGEEKYARFVLAQLEDYRHHGFVGEYGLAVHSYDIERGIPCAGLGWGRGTAWWMFAAVMSLKESPDAEIKEELSKLAVEICDHVIDFQHKDGGWSSMIAGGRFDSGATAMLSYCLMEASAALADDRYLMAAKCAVPKLMSVTRNDGAVDYCEGDSHGPGSYSRRFAPSPFAQGFTILLIRGLEARGCELAL